MPHNQDKFNYAVPPLTEKLEKCEIHFRQASVQSEKRQRQSGSEMELLEKSRGQGTCFNA